MQAAALPRPVMLVILDGWGWREEFADNAVRQAKAPSFDALWASCPHAFLKTSGQDVGLPVGQMGNSEVGHLNIGAGRVVMQDLPRIDAASPPVGCMRIRTRRWLWRNCLQARAYRLPSMPSPMGVTHHRARHQII